MVGWVMWTFMFAEMNTQREYRNCTINHYLLFSENEITMLAAPIRVTKNRSFWRIRSREDTTLYCSDTTVTTLLASKLNIDKTYFEIYLIILHF